MGLGQVYQVERKKSLGLDLFLGSGIGRGFRSSISSWAQEEFGFGFGIRFWDDVPPALCSWD